MAERLAEAVLIK